MEKVKISKEQLKTIKETAEKLLKLMGFKKAKISLEENTDQAVLVSVDDIEDEGILIGNEGQTLFALQMMLAIIVFRKSGSWVKTYVNVGSYLEERQKRLEKMALSAAEKVKETGEEVEMPRLNPAERRIVHMKLAEDKKVMTESEERGYRRVLVVKPTEV